MVPKIHQLYEFRHGIWYIDWLYIVWPSPCSLVGQIHQARKIPEPNSPHLPWIYTQPRPRLLKYHTSSMSGVVGLSTSGAKICCFVLLEAKMNSPLLDYPTRALLRAQLLVDSWGTAQEHSSALQRHERLTEWASPLWGLWRNSLKIYYLNIEGMGWARGGLSWLEISTTKSPEVTQRISSLRPPTRSREDRWLIILDHLPLFTQPLTAAHLCYYSQLKNQGYFWIHRCSWHLTLAFQQTKIDQLKLCAEPETCVRRGVPFSCF